MSVDIDKLEQLYKAATHLPWKVSDIDDRYIVDASGKRELARVSMRYRPYPERAEYIVAACNAVPELIARVRELEKALIEVVKLEVPLPECAVCWDKDKCADRAHGDNCLTIQDIINVAKEAVRTNKQ